jgi:BarA-like signal transduction histidine kinase
VSVRSFINTIGSVFVNKHDFSGAVRGALSIAQFVRAAVKLEKEQKIKASRKTFFAVFDQLSIAIIAVGCIEQMKTKRLLQRYSGASVDRPIALHSPHRLAQSPYSRSQ